MSSITPAERLPLYADSPTLTYRGQPDYPNRAVFERSLRNALADEGLAWSEEEPLFDEAGRARWIALDAPLLSYLARRAGMKPAEYSAYRKQKKREYEMSLMDLEEAKRRHNLLPFVEAHQDSPAACDRRCRQAEADTRINLPVVTASRTTGTRENERAIQLAQLPPDASAWSKLRNAILRRDHFTCQRCNERMQKERLSVHHIKPRFEKGTDDPANLISLCHPCHDFVEIQDDPPLRTRAQIIGSQRADTHGEQVFEVRNEIAKWAGRRKPHDLIHLWADKLSGLGLTPKAISDEIGISDRLLRTAWKSA